MITDPIEKRKHKQGRIEYLLRKEFPSLNISRAPAPITPIGSRGSHDPAAELDAQAVAEQQSFQDARRARQVELSRMPDDEFDALCERVQSQEREQDRIRRENQTPTAKEPDADFWTREDEWLLLDGALLLVKLEPRAGLGLHLKKMLSGDFEEGGRARESESPSGLSDDAQQRRYRVSEIIRRAGVAGRNGNLFIARNGTVEPRSFLIWAGDKGYQPPQTFESLLVGVRSRVEIEQERDALKARLSEGQENRWPWGDHDTKLLGHLAAAADHFWKRYDSNDPTTAPTNNDVTAWLTKRAVPARVAEIMAQILRADGLKRGPRK